MKTSDRSRFEIGALRALAGDKVFARGAEYHRDGLVQILALEPGRVLAQVAGNEVYRTVVTDDGTQIGGECSCPAFEDWDFCKHIVAAALAANASAGDPDAEGHGALSRICNHLKTKNVDALAAMIVDLAERDPMLFRKLEMAAAALEEDDKKLEARLRKAIDSATRIRDFVDYRAAAGWAAEVDAALGALAELASGKRAGVVLKLADRAIERIERAAEDIDDSDGHCTTLLERARNIHLAAARTARPEPIRFARELFASEMASDYDTFHGAAGLYADVLDAEGLTEYRRLAAAAWDQLPPLRGGREDEALRRAEEGLWVFEDDRPDERLVAFTAQLLMKAGRSKDAEAHLWRAFEKAPSIELYNRLRQLGDETARDRALEFLETRLGREERTRWHYPADLLVSILMHEKMFDQAWAAVRKHGASNGLKEQLAQASEAPHPCEAIDTYAERVDQLANSGGDRAYAEAAALIGRIAGLRDSADQAAYLAALKARFGRKRNFMKLLP